MGAGGVRPGRQEWGCKVGQCLPASGPAEKGALQRWDILHTNVSGDDNLQFLVQNLERRHTDSH